MHEHHLEFCFSHAIALNLITSCCKLILFLKIHFLTLHAHTLITLWGYSKWNGEFCNQSVTKYFITTMKLEWGWVAWRKVHTKPEVSAMCRLDCMCFPTWRQGEVVTTFSSFIWISMYAPFIVGVLQMLKVCLSIIRSRWSGHVNDSGWRRYKQLSEWISHSLTTLEGERLGRRSRGMEETYVMSSAWGAGWTRGWG